MRNFGFCLLSNFENYIDIHFYVIQCSKLKRSAALLKREIQVVVAHFLDYFSVYAETLGNQELSTEPYKTKRHIG